MNISESQLNAALKDIYDVHIEPYIRERIAQELEGAMRLYRQSVSTVENWCCQDLQGFAREVWNLAGPPQRNPDMLETTSLEYGSESITLR